MIKCNFSDKSKSHFELTLKQRVNQYFKDSKQDKTSGKLMLLKTFLIFIFYSALYLIIISGVIPNYKVLLFLSILLGVGQAIVGMNIMHDFVHGTYKVNKLCDFLLKTTVVLIGVNSFIWKIEHNVIHHSFTNINGLDQDIHPRFVFRFSYLQKKRWFHRYQHIYASFFYCFMIIEWLTVKDFLKLNKFYKEGYIKNKKELLYKLLFLAFEKTIFYAVFLIIPFYQLNIGWIVPILMFLIMLMSAGLLLTIIFQLAHVVPSSTFLDKKQEVSINWFIYQVETTANFANNSKLVSLLTGGLNYQIEHHLFPNICHTHYPEIAPIVKETAKEFNIKYNYTPTFYSAVFSHFSFLKSLGR